MSNKFELTVKSFKTARNIAEGLRFTNPLAAKQYMDKYELRRSIETAAQSAGLGVQY